MYPIIFYMLIIICSTVKESEKYLCAEAEREVILTTIVNFINIFQSTILLLTML